MISPTKESRFFEENLSRFSSPRIPLFDYTLTINMLVLRSTTFYVLERQNEALREHEPLALRALNDHHDFLQKKMLLCQEMDFDKIV